MRRCVSAAVLPDSAKERQLWLTLNPRHPQQLRSVKKHLLTISSQRRHRKADRNNGPRSDFIALADRAAFPAGSVRAAQLSYVTFASVKRIRVFAVSRKFSSSF
jgi:hypothetical protein